ncbi:MAG: hypothetical protein O2971_03700 [Proteobacteria bacterium]|nr:hypothetical protein [Pseudomonadota bacterium]
MSKHESWRTRAYWEKVGGLLIEEFQAVSANSGGNVARRLIDGLIVLGEETTVRSGGSFDISGRDVICIQTKGSRLGMYLMGQAFFSRELLMKLNPLSIRTVAICSKNDELMSELCAAQDIEVVVMPDSQKMAS